MLTNESALNGSVPVSGSSRVLAGRRVLQTQRSVPRGPRALMISDESLAGLDN